MTQSLAQNPDELFDVVTFDGRPTGITRRRADVHRDGDWHRAVHVWFLSARDGDASIILQRRSLAKDSLPGKLDATVGGHLNAGESITDALRETEEEIGVSISTVTPLFAGRNVAVGEWPGPLIDRELQDVYFVRDDRPLSAYRPNPVELAALIRIRIDDLLALLSQETDQIRGESRLADQPTITRTTVTRDDFQDVFSRYYYRVAIAARAFLDGAQHFSV